MHSKLQCERLCDELHELAAEVNLVLIIPCWEVA